MELDVAFRTGVPLRRQLEDALRVAIRSGRLGPGSVLPPSRDLAHQLGVSRGVVVGSYAQLGAEGYLATQRGSGTRVARLPETGSPPPRIPRPAPQRYRYDLRPGQADYHAFPRARWKAALLQALRDLPDHRLAYAGHRGIYELRSAIAEYLARMRGVVVEPNQVVVCCAASQALTVIWDVLRRRGVRRVAIEDPGWRWQRYTAEHAGLEVVPVRVDADGLVVSDLAAGGVDAVVVTPAHQYPTGVVMTAERRSALLAWAHERQALIDEVENVMMVTGVTPPTLDQLALASFIGDAALERHLRAMRRRYRAKRDTLVGALHTYLPEVRVGGTAAGLHLLAQLPDGTDERATALRAREAGVGVHEVHRHCTARAPFPPALLLGFALPGESELIAATQLLAGAVR